MCCLRYSWQAKGTQGLTPPFALVCIALLRECMLCVLASLQPLLLAGGQEM